MNRSEEKKRFVEFEDRLAKLSTQLAEFSGKYEVEASENEKLKLQIQHNQLAMKLVSYCYFWPILFTDSGWKVGEWQYLMPSYLFTKLSISFLSFRNG